MNKKFSTLVAVLLAAGAWTTLSADVVVSTDATPAAGTYAIGTTLDGSAVTLALGSKTDATLGSSAVNEVKVTQAEKETTFADVTDGSKWQLISDGEAIATSAKLKVTIGEASSYYLGYDGSTFSLIVTTDDTNENILHVKDDASGLIIVAGGKEYNDKFLSVTGEGLKVVEGTPTLFAIPTSGTASLGSLTAGTEYVLTSAATLGDGGTYYLTGNFEEAKEATPAFYSLEKADAAEITKDNAATYVIWTVTAGNEPNQFTLSTVENDVTYVVVADKNGVLTAVDNAKGNNVEATAFKLVQGELVSADGTKELNWKTAVKMEAASTEDLTNAIQFGQWEDVETPPVVETPSYPGYEDVTVNPETGVVTVGEGASLDAPLYVAIPTAEKPTYLSVNSDGKVVESETPVAGVASAWGVENGVYYSIAQKRANVAERYLIDKSKQSAENAIVPKSAPALSENYILGARDAAGAVKSNGGTVVATINSEVTAATPVGNVSILSQSVARVSEIDKDEYVFVALNDITNGVKTVLGVDGKAAPLASVTEENLENYLWKVTETKNDKGAYYYTFKNMYSDKLWSVDADNTEFYATSQYAAGTDLYLSNNGKNIGEGFAAADPAVAISLYKSPLVGRTIAYLNALLGDGFKMTIKTAKDSKDEVEYLDAFAGKLTAQGAADAQQFQIKSGNKFLVLNTTKLTNISGVNGAFELVDKVDADNHWSYFQINHLFGGKAADLVAELKVAKAASMIDATKAFIVKTPDANYLTTKKDLTGSEVRPYIILGEDNIYPIKNLLGQYLTFSYADTRANAKENKEDYKYAGVLAVINENGSSNEANYVPASTVLLSSPEAQWAVVNVIDGKATLQNRENSAIKITGVQFRLVEGDKFLVTSGNTNFNDDLVTIGKTEAKGRLSYDGFMQTTENTLRNQNFYLGQYHAIEGNNNAYFVENHTDAASHQIGMTAEKENAQKWNLHFAMKKDDDGKYTLVDTVKVITKFYTLKSDGNQETDPKKMVIDTLAILPYAFQNASNREFVSYNDNTNYKYYYCNKENKENKDQDASRFALKMKPNGTYNFVNVTALTSENEAAIGDNKVYVANSLTKGSLKNMLTYAEDNNSLMVVEVADAPEYHKIAAAWGDTIKLFREENHAQVLYEKHDAKSVVDKKVLSFLNIDNTNQFDVNPAIFADTAYVNRTINGEANTCYQYLLAVNVDPEKSYYCPYNPEHNTDEWRAEHNGPCADAKEHRAVYGRFLINLIDTANVYGATHLHSNPYINAVEAGEDRAKLSFVEGYHADDTLYVTRKGGEMVKLAMDSPEFNVAKFAFRYTDSEAKTFKIQTQYKEYDPETAVEDRKAPSNDGYLKWINGTVVVTNGYENGDVFGIEENYEGNPTANEGINGAAAFSVATIDGAVVISGAEGKNITITNVLGQPVASTVITSSEATISVPAGVVIVAVEGEEAVKAIVK